jgi:hypothetical protein
MLIGIVKMVIYGTLGTIVLYNTNQHKVVVTTGLNLLMNGQCGEHIVGGVSNFFSQFIGLDNVAYNPVCKVYHNTQHTLVRVLAGDAPTIIAVTKTMSIAGGVIVGIDKTSEIVAKYIPNMYIYWRPNLEATVFAFIASIELFSNTIVDVNIPTSNTCYDMDSLRGPR